MGEPGKVEPFICGGLNGAAGKTVSRGAGEGRLIAIGNERPGENPASRLS
jgi:hypothetical protein